MTYRFEQGATRCTALAVAAAGPLASLVLVLLAAFVASRIDPARGATGAMGALACISGLIGAPRCFHSADMTGEKF